MRPRRTKILKVRLTEDELNQLSVLVDIHGKPERCLSRLVRARLFSSCRHSSHPGDCKHCRLLVAAINNTNLIARRCADIADPETTVQVIAHLAAIEREIRKAAGHPHK